MFNKVEDEIIVRVKAEMQKQGITSYRLEQMTGVMRKSIDNWLHGQSKPSYDKVKAIEEALGIETVRVDSGSVFMASKLEWYGDLDKLRVEKGEIVGSLDATAHFSNGVMIAVPFYSKGSFVVRLTDDSMQKKIADESFLVISPHNKDLEQLANHCIILYADGQAYCRKYNKMLHLAEPCSTNMAHKPINMADKNVIVLGSVAYSFSNLE